MLHNALPALERLYAKWEKASNKARYEKFKSALIAGMAKLNEYYQHSGASDAHLLAMGKPSVPASFILTDTAVVLNPISKMNHFKKQWSRDLVSEVEDAVRARVCIPFFWREFQTTDSLPSLSRSSPHKTYCMAMKQRKS